MRLQFNPPKQPSQEDSLFPSLKQVVPKMRTPTGSRRISVESFTPEQRCLCNLGCQVRSLLNGDRWRRVTEAGTVAETLLVSDPPLVKETCHRIQGQYKTSSNRTPTPAFIKLSQITVYWVELYCRVPPTWCHIPKETAPFAIYDSIPMMDYI